MSLGLFRKRAPEPTPQPTDEQLLAFEAKWGEHRGAKGLAIQDDLGIRPARYYQLLGRLIWTEEALRIDPILTNRLRRLSVARRQTTADRHH